MASLSKRQSSELISFVAMTRKKAAWRTASLRKDRPGNQKGRWAMVFPRANPGQWPMQCYCCVAVQQTDKRPIGDYEVALLPWDGVARVGNQNGDRSKKLFQLRVGFQNSEAGTAGSE
jgi:hypothetical protein